MDDEDDSSGHEQVMEEDEKVETTADKSTAKKVSVLLYVNFFVH